MPTLSSDIGLTLEVSDRFVEAPQFEVGPVCLVAQVDPWQFPADFRPNITVEVDALAPERATVVQLSALTIAAQIALGRHVVACDVWMGPDEQELSARTGRRIIAVYPAMGMTVVSLLYVGVRGNRAVTISVQGGAGNYPDINESFDLAVRSLHCAFDDPPVTADPATMPHIDAFVRDVLHEPLELEDLGGVRAAQPSRDAGPRLAEDELKALRRGKLRRGTDIAGLVAAGFVGEDRRLTELGEAAHEGLDGAMRQLTLEVRCDRDPGTRVLSAYMRPESIVVVADAPPGDPGTGTGRTVEVTSVSLLAERLVRWLSVSPAWTLAIDDDSRTHELDAALLDARLADPAAPPPQDANPGLRRLWSLPWQEVTLISTQRGSAVQRIVMTTEAGAFRVERDGSSGTATLTPLPSATYLSLLLRFGGFDI